jgi:hypothetical protein
MARSSRPRECSPSGEPDHERGFRLLRRYARTHHVRLSEVAREVVETNLAATDVLGAPGSQGADQR